MKNVPRPDGFHQVCVWPGTIVGEDVEGLVQFMLTEFDTRIVYLEEIKTLPGDGGPGGRNDLFFAVHHNDIPKFAVPRLGLGIRWIEDAIAPVNGGCALYPRRVQAYRGWLTECGGCGTSIDGEEGCGSDECN